MLFGLWVGSRNHALDWDQNPDAPMRRSNFTGKDVYSTRVCPTTLCCELYNKTSIFAEMGDRLATKDVGQKSEDAPVWREVDPNLTQCGLDRDLPPHQAAS